MLSPVHPIPSRSDHVVECKLIHVAVHDQAMVKLILVSPRDLIAIVWERPAEIEESLDGRVVRDRKYVRHDPPAGFVERESPAVLGVVVRGGFGVVVQLVDHLSPEMDFQRSIVGFIIIVSLIVIVIVW